MVEGKVIYVSADAVTDRDARREAEPLAPRRYWFITRVQLDARDVRNKIVSFRATPGMPADVYIKTGERTSFNYILRPLLESLSRAFREN